MGNIQKILALMLLFLCTNFIQAAYKSCSVESNQKLQSALKNKSLSLLFLNQTEKVFNKTAINNRKVDSKALDEMESLFVCGLNYLEKNKKLSEDIVADGYIPFMNDIIAFLSAKDENGQKKALSGTDLFLTTPKIFFPFINSLKEFNRWAYMSMVLNDDKILKDKKAFDKYFINGGFETRFFIYKRFIDDENNAITIDENGKLAPKNYSLVANFALMKNLSINQLKSLTGQDRIKEALKVVDYYNEFRIRAGEEVKSLEKKLNSFFTFNKAAIREKIEKLNNYIFYSEQILMALLINDLYKQVPPAFIQKIANAPADYGIIFGQTEALLKTYDTVVKLLSSNG